MIKSTQKNKPAAEKKARLAGKPPSEEKPKWQKSPQQLQEMFARLQAGLPPEAEKRKMFGYPCSFVNGQMFTGLHQANMVLRLSEPDRAEFLALAGAKTFEPMPGRKMKEYVVVPPSLKSDEGTLFKWLLRSFSYARSLGPKMKK